METNEMAFPETWQEFADWWSINDSEQVYSNGVDLLPMHRVEQMMEHYYEPVMKANTGLACKVMTLESEFADWVGQYDPTDAYVKNVQEENAKLRAANARLSGELDAEHALAEGLGHMHEIASAENAKLRELVQDYDKTLSSMHALCDCDFAPLNNAVLLALRSRMYKLGIEVD